MVLLWFTLQKKKIGFVCIYGKSQFYGEMCLEFVGLVWPMSTCFKCYLTPFIRVKLRVKSWVQNSLGVCVT